MLLSAVIICCMIVVNAEPPFNSYSFTGDSNGYDYGNTVVNNGYLGSKDNYQNGGSFYGVGDTGHKLPNQISSHSLINAGNQGSVGGDVGNSYNGYSANNHGTDYAGYSNTYNNPESDTYTMPTHVTSSIPFRGYSNSNNNGESTFNAYSSDTVHKNPDFGQYTASSSSSSKRNPVYSGFSRSNVLENYSKGSTDNSADVQEYHGSLDSSSYSESDHVHHSPYSSGGPVGEYSFGKQKDGPYNLKGGKYSDIYPISSSEMRYTRGNAGHVSHNRDVPPPYISGSVPSNHFVKPHNSGIYSSGKPSKYGYKYLSRYAPNNGVTYLSRERDGYYAPYGKGSGKVIVIKDSRPSYTGGHVYSNEPPYSSGNSGYRSKSGGFMSGYSASPNFDGYSGSSNNYDDGPTIPRRYRTSGPMLVQKTIYP